MGRKVGAIEQLFHRLVYMLTFSLVNLDVKPNGEIAHHFLVKRLIGMPGDRIRQVNGKMEIMPAAENGWIPESTLIEEPLKRKYLKKTIPYELYPLFYNYFKGAIEKSRGLPVDFSYLESEQKILKAGIAVNSGEFTLFRDEDYEMVFIQSAIYYKLQPNNERISSLWSRFDLGFYIPENRFFPMGDNRDNSHDARYFNPVLLNKVLGRAAFRFWPLQRIGIVE
jgi:signal peptidase I